MARHTFAGGTRHARRWTALLAAGSAALILPVTLSAGIAGADSPVANLSELPLPLAAGPIPNVYANDVACPSAGNCTAVGQFQDTIGITHAQALNLSGSTWTTTQIAAPNDAPDYTVSDLNGVSCVSVGNCVAVGDYTVSTVKQESFYAVETSGVWARGQVMPLPGDARAAPAQTTFLSASCVPGGTTCRMIGEYVTTAGAINSVVNTYTFGTGLTGGSIELSPGPGLLDIGLDSISCVDNQNCVAVGSQLSSVAEVASYVELKAGVWQSPGVLTNPAGAVPASEFLSSVSCVGQGDCVAAGDWTDANSTAHAETYTISGWAWSGAVDVATASSYSNPAADDLSCSTITTCTLVGAVSDHTGALRAATAQMTSGSWGQLATASVPLGAVPDNELLGVSCTTAGNQCTSVGYYNDSTGNKGTEGMAATWTPGAPPGAPSGLHAVSESPHSVQLAWSASGNPGAGFSHYELFAQAAGHNVLDKGPTLALSGVVSALIPGARYTFSVIAVAIDGQTSPAATLVVTVPPTTPTAPTIVRVAGIHHGIRVQWGAPRATGGAPITGYKVTASCGASTHTARFGGSTRIGNVTGLSPGRVCYIRVTATNRAGSGPASGPAAAYPQR